MIKLIKESGFNENGFAVTGYLYDNQRGAVADRYFDPDEWSEVEDYAHNLLMKGLFVNIVYFKTGDSININPDEYRNEFDGEFVINSEIAKFKKLATLQEDVVPGMDPEEVQKGVDNTHLRDLKLVLRKFERENPGKNLDKKRKRIANTDEFDNGRVMRGDWKVIPALDAELEAKRKSIENPNKVYYVQYDDVMLGDSPVEWSNGVMVEY